MVDIGGIFGGDFAAGFQQSQDALLGQRQKTAELFMRFQQQNPTASFEQYQDFLNQVSPNRWLRGPGYSDEALQQLAAEGQRKLAVQQEKDRLDVVEKQLSTQDKYTTLVDKFVNNALTNSSENDNGDAVRQRVRKSLEAAKIPLDGQIAGVLDSIDYDGRLREHRGNKRIEQAGKIQNLVAEYEDSDKSPEVIETELKSLYSGDVASAVRSKIEARRNEKRRGILDNLSTAITTDPSTGGILLDENQNLGDYIEGYAKKKQITLTQDERDQLRRELELRRKEAREKQDTAEIEQTKRAQEAVKTLIDMDNEDDVRKAIDKQSFSQGLKDTMLGQWRSAQNAKFIDRMTNLKTMLNPMAQTADGLIMKGLIETNDEEGIRQKIKTSLAGMRMSLPDDYIDNLVRDFMGAQRPMAEKNLHDLQTQRLTTLKAQNDEQKKTLIATFDAKLKVATKQEDKDFYTIAQGVAATGVDATTLEIENAIRAVLSANKNATVGEATTRAAAMLKSHAKTTAEQLSKYNNVTDQKQLASTIFTGVDQATTRVAELEQRLNRYLNGDASALTFGDKTATVDQIKQMITNYVSDAQTLRKRIQDTLEVPENAQVNLIPKGRQTFTEFNDKLEMLVNKLNTISNSFDKNRNAVEGASLEQKRLSAEQTVKQIYDLKQAAATEANPDKAREMMKQANDLERQRQAAANDRTPFINAAREAATFASDPELVRLRLKASAEKIAKDLGMDKGTAEQYLNAYYNRMTHGGFDQP